ncbi:hypothetical protein BpHYR1_048545 [Brachionus plicatilis]|uniref:HTH psq-type domain-containing protein n=1 Tax=Brachionus plicatilis TaxID=10195 RepID=A0A3M7QJP8_BRAPC|nr:hypothetical protein BpHYR1_048545 [Brachionus plicatilis]
MPRSNFQKTQKAYSEKTLQIAIAEIEAKKLNKHQTSVRFNIPYSTLNDRINEKYKRPANVEKQIKKNGFLVRNVTIGHVENAFQEALI